MTAKNGVLEMEMQPRTEAVDALVPAPEMSMIERVARDPNASVETLERLIAMQERINAHNAEAAFNVAFSEMSPQIPTIYERARTDKTTYAPLEDIIEVIRPIYSRHGFTLGFQTEWPNDNSVKVIGILTHNQGHARRSEFKALADTSGSKNAIQALGSTVSYGKRYVTKDLFCIVTREEDDDGRRAGRKVNGPPAPEGFDAWLANIEAVADEGTEALRRAWEASHVKFRNYLSATDKGAINALKARAAKAGAK